MQIIIHASEKGIPMIKGSSLFAILYIGKIKSNRMAKLNIKKYKSIFFLIFILTRATFYHISLKYFNPITIWILNKS